MPTDLDERIAKAKAVVRDLEEALEFIRQKGLFCVFLSCDTAQMTKTPIGSMNDYDWQQLKDALDKIDKGREQIETATDYLTGIYNPTFDKKDREKIEEAHLMIKEALSNIKKNLNYKP